MRHFVYFLLLFTSVYAQSETINPKDYKERHINAVHLDEPLDIDGFLDESFYLSPSNKIFFQYVPNNGELSSEETEAWVGYDDNAIYVAARLWDSQPDSIVARLGRRDSGDNSDLFQVIIDSYHDRRSGYFFVVNPVGTITDGTVANDNHFDTSWDGIWEGKASIDSTGWSAEMRIPFSQLRFNKLDENVMGFGLGRRIHRREEQDLYNYVPRDVSGFVSYFPVLHGIKNIKPPKRVEITPYITSNYSSLPSENDNPFIKGKSSMINVGTDLKIGLGNNLTLDATIYPDFGQVEVDPSQLNLSDFEIFYQEKRPFFIEGASIFRFGRSGPTNHYNFNVMAPQFFYSRRIGRSPQRDTDDFSWVGTPTNTSILGAGKISGKLSPSWSIGGLSVLTAREFAKVDDDEDQFDLEVEPLTSFNLVRAQKEIQGGIHGLGIIGTYVTRNFKDRDLRNNLLDNALTVGIDGWTFFNEDRAWALSGWLGLSRINGSPDKMLNIQESSPHYFQKPDVDHIEIDSSMTSMNGWASRFNLNRESGNWIINAALGTVSPEFENNDMGLSFRTDQIYKHLVIGYKWFEPTKMYNEAAFNLATYTNHNFAWDKINQSVFMFGYMQFANFWTAEFFSGVGPNTISDSKLRGGPLVGSPKGIGFNFDLRSDSRKNYIYSFETFVAKMGDGGSIFNFTPGIEINLGTRLQLEIEPEFSRENIIDQYIDVFDDPDASAMFGKRYILAELDRKTIAAELRINYTFSPTISLQAYIQPYMSVGSYSHFKEFVKPRSFDFMEYGDNGSTIVADGDDYILDPTGGDNADAIIMENPDFNFKALIGNAVLRWEFRPGSTLYFVWTRNGSNEDHPGEFNFGRDMRKMLSAQSDNIFAFKVTYWFNP